MNLRNVRKRKVGTFHGFTLVELIVVITILAVLATIGFLALSGYSQDAKDSAIRANVRSVQTAIASESAVTNRSPRYYVVHDSGAALSGALVYVDGNPTSLTGGDWNAAGTNYSAGNPDYAKLKLNPEKFKVSASGLPGGTLGVLARTAGFVPAEAAYDPRYLTVGAADAAAGTSGSGKKRTASYFQVAAISPATGAVTVSGNYPSSSGSVAGLVKDPKASSSTGALWDGGTSGMGEPPVAGTCGTANKAYAFSATSFGSDTFCPAGAVSSPASPAFPSAGNSVSWTCPGQNGGAAANCSASHVAGANCAAGTQTVNGHSYSLSAFNNGNTLAGTSAAVAVTGGNLTYSQTFLCTDGAVTTNGTETLGTLTCTAAGFANVGGICLPNSCSAIKTAYPASADGTYSIDPDGAGAFASFSVLCDMTTDGGGWTVFQERYSGAQDFYLGWTSYVNGFGTPGSGEYWLGLNKLNAIAGTSKQAYVALTRNTNATAYAKYSSFSIGGSGTNYALTVSGYTGTAGDSLSSHS